MRRVKCHSIINSNLVTLTLRMACEISCSRVNRKDNPRMSITCMR